MPIERRCALVPGSAFLSPEEAQLILRHRKSLRSLAVSFSDRGPSQATRRPAKPSCNADQTEPTWRPCTFEKPETCHQVAPHVQGYPGGPLLESTLSAKDPRPLSSFHLLCRGQPNHLQSQGSSRIRSDNKRKHSPEWQGSPRRRPTEIFEDTPHVSELDSDDGITPIDVEFLRKQAPSGIGDKVRFYVPNFPESRSKFAIN